MTPTIGAITTGGDPRSLTTELTPHAPVLELVPTPVLALVLAMVLVLQLAQQTMLGLSQRMPGGRPKTRGGTATGMGAHTTKQTMPHPPQRNAHAPGGVMLLRGRQCYCSTVSAHRLDEIVHL